MLGGGDILHLRAPIYAHSSVSFGTVEKDDRNHSRCVVWRHNFVAIGERTLVYLMRILW